MNSIQTDIDKPNWNAKQLQQLFRQAPVMLVIFQGENFILESVNEAALQAWNKKEDEMTGKPFFEVFPGLKTVMLPILQNVYYNEKPFIENEFQINDTANDRMPEGFFNFVYQPAYNDKGRITSVIAVGTEIIPYVNQQIHKQKSVSEKPQSSISAHTDELAMLNAELREKNIYLRNSQDFFQQVMDSSVEFISVIDRELNYITVNKHFETQMKILRRDLEGKNLFDIAPKARNTIQHESILKALSGETTYLDKRPSVSLPGIFIDTHFLPLIIQDNVEGVIIMARDVSDIVRSEKLLEQKNEELLRSNQDLQQFAHVASHDLKEPLRKIKTFAGRLSDEFQEALPEKAQFFLSKIESAVDRMNEMIEGVLEYSFLNAGLQDIQPIDLKELIQHITEDLEIMIAEKKAIVEYQDLPVLEGSQILIRQLFYNLLNNSVKFSKAEATNYIFISSQIVFVSERKFAQIEIRDAGIGFEQDQAANIFDFFTRLNSRDKYEGTGLGLSLCKKIVERHEGSIYANGELNKGASMIIKLPLVQTKKII